MSTAHQQNLGMEILATLSGVAAKLEDLAEDFGVTPSEIRQAINDLRLKGFIISLDWCGAYIPHHHRKRATIAAQEYFEALYDQ